MRGHETMARALCLMAIAACAAQPGDLTDPEVEGGTALDVPPQRLPPSPALPLEWSIGAPLAPAVVTGRIYDDLATHAPKRMRDLAALGVRAIRVEIERETSWATYRTIVDAARAHGIEILAVVSVNSVPADTPSPLAGTLADFDATFVPAYIAALDETVAKLGVRFVEVWNEPDVYGFAPMFTWSPTSCTRLPGATRYALLAVRVYETLDQRRRNGIATPTIAAFGVSRQDDDCLRRALVDAVPIYNHRFGYRVPHGVVAHRFGQPGRAIKRSRDSPREAPNST